MPGALASGHGMCMCMPTRLSRARAAPLNTTAAIVPRMHQAVLDAGISSIAVVLKHAAIFPRHEQMVGQLAQEMGFKQVRWLAAR